MTERNPRKKKKTAADYRKRKHSCTFFLSADEHAALVRVMAARGCSASEFMRAMILRADASLRPKQQRATQSIVIDPRQLVIETA